MNRAVVDGMEAQRLCERYGKACAPFQSWFVCDQVYFPYTVFHMTARYPGRRSITPVEYSRVITLGIRERISTEHHLHKVTVRFTDHVIVCPLKENNFNKPYRRHQNALHKLHTSYPTQRTLSNLSCYYTVSFSCFHLFSAAHAMIVAFSVQQMLSFVIQRYMRCVCPWDKQIPSDLNSKAVRKQASFKLTHKQVCVHKSVAQCQQLGQEAALQNGMKSNFKIRATV